MCFGREKNATGNVSRCRPVDVYRDDSSITDDENTVFTLNRLHVNPLLLPDARDADDPTTTFPEKRWATVAATRWLTRRLGARDDAPRTCGIAHTCAYGEMCARDPRRDLDVRCTTTAVTPGRSKHGGRAGWRRLRRQQFVNTGANGERSVTTRCALPTGTEVISSYGRSRCAATAACRTTVFIFKRGKKRPSDKPWTRTRGTFAVGGNEQDRSDGGRRKTRMTTVRANGRMSPENAQSRRSAGISAVTT